MSSKSLLVFGFLVGSFCLGFLFKPIPVEAATIPFVCTGTAGAYDSYTDDNELVEIIENATADDIIQISGTCALTRQIVINHGVTVTGPATIQADSTFNEFTGGSAFRNNLISITDVPAGQSVVLSNLTVLDSIKSGIDIVNSDDVTLNNIDIQNSQGGAGVVVNGATVTANNLTTSGSDWGVGVNVGLDSTSYPTAESHFNWVTGSANETIGAISVDQSMDPSKVSLMVSGVSIPYDAINGVLVENSAVKTKLPSNSPSGKKSSAKHRGLSAPTTPSCGDKVPAGTPDLFQITRKGNSATLYFSPISDRVERYHVVYGYSEGQELFGQISAEVTEESGGGVQVVTIDNLDPKQAYAFQVMPVNGCAVGERSNWLTIHKTGTTSYRYK